MIFFIIHWLPTFSKIFPGLAAVCFDHLYLLRIVKLFTFAVINLIIYICQWVLRVLCCFLINKWMNDTHADKVKNSLSKCHSWFVGTDRIARGCPWSKFFPRKLSYKVDFYQMRFKEKIRMVVSINVLKQNKTLKNNCYAQGAVPSPSSHPHFFICLTFIDHIEY